MLRIVREDRMKDDVTYVVYYEDGTIHVVNGDEYMEVTEPTYERLADLWNEIVDYLELLPDSEFERWLDRAVAIPLKDVEEESIYVDFSYRDWYEKLGII